MAGSEGASREMLAEHAEVHLYQQQASFPLEVCRACHQVAAGDDAHCCVLDPLELLNVGGVGVGEPNDQVAPSGARQDY